MSVSRIHIIIALASLALLGITALQIHQFRKALALSKAHFRAGVGDALQEVVDQLEGTELKTNLVRVSRELSVNLGNQPPGLPPARDTLILQVPAERPHGIAPQRIRIRDSLAIVTEQETYLNLDSALSLQGGLSYTYFTSGDSTGEENLQVAFSGSPRVIELMNRTFRGLHTPGLRIEERVDSLQLDTLIGQALADQGISLDYRFLVSTDRGKRIALRSATGRVEEYLQSQYQVQLFPYIGTGEKNYLHLVFPGQNGYALRAVWLEACLSLLLTAIVFVCFWITIRMVFRQKRLSEMKNDFINNMTHELKTPIATIAVAADALAKDQVRQSPERIDRYLRIIREENQRMHRQVDRVLQAARFDRGKIQLSLQLLDLHRLIEEACEIVRLQVESRGGSLATHLDAPRSEVQGDAIHLLHLLNNLLDNAIKYSPDLLEIRVTTAVQDSRLLIHVADRGQGISKADQAEIFTRFYRVPTGNLHDVKGFGLGLSYAKEIAEAHGGSISVESAPGKGSTFTLALPLADSAPLTSPPESTDAPDSRRRS
ncbi:MAG: HAMP domain-containing sensor histidine kinase [Bacteroidia bacterium]